MIKELLSRKYLKFKVLKCLKRNHKRNHFISVVLTLTPLYIRLLVFQIVPFLEIQCLQLHEHFGVYYSLFHNIRLPSVTLMKHLHIELFCCCCFFSFSSQLLSLSHGYWFGFLCRGHSTIVSNYLAQYHDEPRRF